MSSAAGPGLRTFAPDRTPVAGFDRTADGFFWLAGQGGYGIQTSPALSRLAGALIRQAALPAEMEAIVPALSPNRFRASQPRIDRSQEGKDMSIRRIEVGPRMSDIVIHGNTVYLAGQVGAPGESVTSQTKAILATIDELLAQGRHRQDQDPAGDHLAGRHVDLPGDERGVGRLGASGPHAGPRHRRGQARRPDYKVEIIITARSDAAGVIFRMRH